MSEFEFDQEIEMCNNRHFDEEDWKERVLSVTDDLALDLVFECFADRRINTLVDNGDLTIQCWCLHDSTVVVT